MRRVFIFHLEILLSLWDICYERHSVCDLTKVWAIIGFISFHNPSLPRHEGQWTETLGECVPIQIIFVNTIVMFFKFSNWIWILQSRMKPLPPAFHVINHATIYDSKLEKKITTRSITLTIQKIKLKTFTFCNRITQGISTKMFPVM